MALDLDAVGYKPLGLHRIAALGGIEQVGVFVRVAVLGGVLFGVGNADSLLAGGRVVVDLILLVEFVRVVLDRAGRQRRKLGAVADAADTPAGQFGLLDDFLEHVVEIVRVHVIGRCALDHIRAGLAHLVALAEPRPHVGDRLRVVYRRADRLDVRVPHIRTRQRLNHAGRAVQGIERRLPRLIHRNGVAGVGEPRLAVFVPLNLLDLFEP